ncbi:MAG: hypothetical protein RBT63_00415 [Bdellovibrionales bacterium]|jgi:hypothetical protein|nr:hypothetical protein [Bdellovibrionales bacterium]
MNYEAYKSASASEKITLAIMRAAQRLVGFNLFSGETYEKSNFDAAVLDRVACDGVTLIAAANEYALAEGEYFHDRREKKLYVRLPESADPHDHFISVTRKLFFASSPITLPHDLANGHEVYFEPMVESTSSFGVELDLVNQSSEAIEGSGTLSLFNDFKFWPKAFDRFFFDNQRVDIYAYSSQLKPSDAKLIFRGRVESKTYGAKITFRLKDIMSDLKGTILLPRNSELGGRPGEGVQNALARMVFGRLPGFRPTNIDSLVNGSYPLTGTISVTELSATVTGAGTQFLKELSPDDQVVIAGEQYSVAAVTNNTTLTLSESWQLPSASGLSVEVKPDLPKRWMNRKWRLAAHPLRQPTPTTLAGSSVSRLFVTSTQDIFKGDKVYVGPYGSGTLVTIDEVMNSTQIKLATSLPLVPPAGTVVTRPCVQNLRIDSTELLFWRDYQVDPETAELTLRATAEANADTVRDSDQSATFTTSSRIVTGVGTSFKSTFQPGWLIRPKGTFDFSEILSVDSDTQMTLRSTPTASATANVQYKSLVLSDETVLSCEIIGRTVDGSPESALIRSAPGAVMALLKDSGLDDEIEAASFESSPAEIAMAIPAKYSDTASRTFRDVINEINASVFGYLHQTNEFKVAFGVLQPSVTQGRLKLNEEDILDVRFETTNKNMLRRVVAEFDHREYDYLVRDASKKTIVSESDIAKYILQTSKEKIYQSVLRHEPDARRLADRWRFLVEFSTGTVEVETKLQALDLEVGDIVEISHEKLFERFGGTAKKKVVFVERVKKAALGVSFAGVDLSNAFNRVAFISNTDTAYQDTPDDVRMLTGFYKGNDDLIDGDDETFFTSLIF